MERVSDERLGEYEHGNAGYQLQIDEMRSIIRELRELREKYAELVEEAFLHGSHLEDSGKYAGWNYTMCSNTYCAWARELIDFGLYELHPDSEGRNMWLRPKEPTP